MHKRNPKFSSPSKRTSQDVYSVNRLKQRSQRAISNHKRPLHTNPNLKPNPYKHPRVQTLAQKPFHSQSKQPLDLLGKTAIVTGGSRGIGLSTVQLFLSRGANVIYCSKSPQSISAAQERIVQAFPSFSPIQNMEQSQDDATQAFKTQLFVTTKPPALSTTPNNYNTNQNEFTQFFQGFHCDVGTESSIQAFFQATKTLKNHPSLIKSASDSSSIPPQLFNGADILVNCAGLCQNQLLLRTTPDMINDVLNINVTGTMLMTKHFLKQLPVFPSVVSRTDGEKETDLAQNNNDDEVFVSKHFSTSINNRHYYRVINISSVVGKQGNPGQAVYATSKAAVDGFTRSMSKEMFQYRANPITFNSIAPGFIETDMTSIMTSDQLTKIVDRVSLRRIGQAEEIANLIGFLASNQSSYINGQNISADGGM